jgi:hypothetical protein
MPDHASLSARSNPVVFIALLTAALTSAALIAAAFSGIGSGAALSAAGSGAAPDLQRAAGAGENGALAAEQRRQAQALEVITLSVSRIQADMAKLNVRIGEAESLYREWVNAAPAKTAQTAPVQIAPAQINAPRVLPAQVGGPEFELAALRASFDGTIDERIDARRQNPPFVRRWRAPHAPRGATIPARTAPSV